MSVYQTLPGVTKSSLSDEDVMLRVLSSIPSDREISQIYKKNLENRYLHFNNIYGKFSYKCIDKKIEKKNNIKYSKKKCKNEGLFNINKKYLYNDYIILNNLWNKYIYNIIYNKNNIDIINILSTCDLHGCCIYICRSKIPSYIGESGIVLMDTEETFYIINKNNKYKYILKKQSIFSIEINNDIYYIHGKHIRMSPGIRSKAKSKPKPNLELL
eukprot:GHVL01007638.1.p1 GENE.GHVL01007638.1~~GHVL01007638.1.p1  ORF type:complete len:214 (+),score=75.59 GHVL01007638.1:66-707(+)